MIRTLVSHRWLVFVVSFVVFAVAILASARERTPPAPPAARPPLPPSPHPGRNGPWLGLDYNSDAPPATRREFSNRGIVYDREGSIEERAGATPENDPQFAAGLDASFGAGMVPDVEVDPEGGRVGCENNPNPQKTCLPTDQASIRRYVRGFVETAHSVLARYRGRSVVFEPMNEPWQWASPPGTRSGEPAATQYAAILAQLLPAASDAGVPLTDIYVPATGQLHDGTSWIPDLYQARPCLRPARDTCGPIAGWNLHPYGLPGSLRDGIDSVPGVRASMLSGQDNVIISEIGFCAVDVNNGAACDSNLPELRGTSVEAAVWLTETLKTAARMHSAGWLRAMLIWERAGSGWAVQNRDGTLTAQGRVLEIFAAER